MEKPGGAGGRPKAAEIWEHVWVLGGNKKKVKCKHCGFEFAASANRIKSHIHQIKGHGIRPCTHFPHQLNTTTATTTKENNDILDSSQQGKGIMERASGGRPKAAEMWEHVWVLKGKKKVKCKHCGFVFAASANRIKSHIHQIKGQGIRLCTHFPHQLSNTTTTSNKENNDILDSSRQDKTGSSDHNKVNERMFDCYMSPKTMWDGIMALQQAHANPHSRYASRED